MVEQISNFKQLEQLVKDGESQILEFKLDNYARELGHKNPILRGVVALANTRGGNLVIGIRKGEDIHQIVGMEFTQDYIVNWFSQLVNSYVDPPDISFTVYELKAEDGMIKCIGIHVPRSGTKYAIRYAGRDSEKDPSYYLLMRIGESTRSVAFADFFPMAFNHLIEGISTLPDKISLKDITSTSKNESKFDVNGANRYLTLLQEDLDLSVQTKILSELRHILSNLRWHTHSAWTDDMKSFTLSLLDWIKEELEEEQQKNQLLDFLRIISDRCDEETFKKIQDNFLKLLNDFYRNPCFDMDSSLLFLLQHLGDYNQAILNRLLMDALDKWGIDEFNQHYTNLIFERSVDYDWLEKQKYKLIRIMSKAIKCGDDDKAMRAETLYDQIRNISF